MSSRIDYDRAASILVEAAYFGDKEAADKWGITTRTVQNYRARLDGDAELSAVFLKKKLAWETSWAEEAPAALRAGIRFLMRAAREADPKDPEAIHAIAGAFKLLAEIVFTKDVLDVRLAEFYRTAGTEADALAAGSPAGFLDD